MNKKEITIYYIGGGLVVLASVYFIYKLFKIKTKKTKKAIIIGDSQSPYIAKQSKKAKLLGGIGNEKTLWKSGENLSWLLNAVKNYPIDKQISDVVISIGTNVGFNKKDNILGLITELKRVFPNAKLFAVKGSWNWGNNKNITENEVNSYYNIFSKNGVIVLPTPIGPQEPHGDRPSYKKIASEIDSLI